MGKSSPNQPTAHREVQQLSGGDLEPSLVHTVSSVDIVADGRGGDSDYTQSGVKVVGDHQIPRIRARDAGGGQLHHQPLRTFRNKDGKDLRCCRKRTETPYIRHDSRGIRNK